MLLTDDLVQQEEHLVNNAPAQTSNRVMTKLVRKHRQQSDLVAQEQEALREESEKEKQDLCDQLNKSQQEVAELKAYIESHTNASLEGRLRQSQQELESLKEVFVDLKVCQDKVHSEFQQKIASHLLRPSVDQEAPITAIDTL